MLRSDASPSTRTPFTNTGGSSGDVTVRPLEGPKSFGRRRCSASARVSCSTSGAASSSLVITYIVFGPACDGAWVSPCGRGGRTTTSPRTGSSARPKSYVVCTTWRTAASSFCAGTKRVCWRAPRIDSTKCSSASFSTRKVARSGSPLSFTTYIVLTRARIPCSAKPAGYAGAGLPGSGRASAVTSRAKSADANESGTSGTSNARSIVALESSCIVGATKEAPATNTTSRYPPDRGASR
jgi:hypothetical protein